MIINYFDKYEIDTEKFEGKLTIIKESTTEFSTNIKENVEKGTEKSTTKSNNFKS